MKINYYKLSLLITACCWVYCLLEGETMASKAITTVCLGVQLWVCERGGADG